MNKPRHLSLLHSLLCSLSSPYLILMCSPVTQTPYMMTTTNLPALDGDNEQMAEGGSWLKMSTKFLALPGAALGGQIRPRLRRETRRHSGPPILCRIRHGTCNRRHSRRSLQRPGLPHSRHAHRHPRRYPCLSRRQPLLVGAGWRRHFLVRRWRP